MQQKSIRRRELLKTGAAAAAATTFSNFRLSQRWHSQLLSR